jgi:hypothetical protein
MPIVVDFSAEYPGSVTARKQTHACAIAVCVYELFNAH